MSAWLLFGFVLGAFALLVGCWLGWQLLRQNGRILLRLDDLEKRLDELEFGEGEESAGLPVGAEAPAFELPDLTGERKSLAQFLGQPALLIFFNPECGFCRELMPKLAAIQKPEGGGQKADGELYPLPLILTTGDAEKNRQFFAEHKVGCPVLLQNDGEVAKAYQAQGTPAGYLINADGKIASSLALGAESLMELATNQQAQATVRPLTPSLSPSGGEGVRRTGEGEPKNLTNRFSNRSLANSKLKRNGLTAGTPAPDFTLPRLDGKGDLSLSDLRGKRALLVFSSPHCGPCNTLAPELEKFHRQQSERDRFPVAAGGHAKVLRALDQRDEVPGAADGHRPRSEGIAVVMISKGEPKENRAKVKEHGLTFPVVLQQQWEISRRYAMFATPIAYLVDEQGVIAREVAVGSDAILELIGQTELIHPATKNGNGPVNRQTSIAAAGVL